MDTQQRILLESISLEELASAVAEKLYSKLPQSKAEEQAVLDVEQAAGLLSLSIPSVWRLKASGSLPYRKIGNGRVVFLRDELLKWINNQ